MVHVTGTVHDVADNPDRVERIVVRAVEPRMHGTTYITEESAQFLVANGVLDFDVLPGPCVVAFLRNHGATTYEKLLVPDVEEATFRECLEAAALAEEGTKSALEKVVRQIQEELNKAAPLLDEVRTLRTEVNESKTLVDGYVKDAQNSASEAASSEANAKTSETNAANSAASAESQQKSAWSHFNNAVKEAEKAAGSAAAAKASETNAASSAAKSATHETNAGASATAAASSADDAKGYAERAEQATDLTGLRNEVTQQISDLVDGSPADLDTLREIAEYAQANRGVTDQLNAAIGDKADKSHTHDIGDVAGLGDALDGKADSVHTHTTSQVDGLDDALIGKSDEGHKHAISDVTGLQDALDSKPTHSTMNSGLNGKADKSHTHTTSQVTGLDDALAATQQAIEERTPQVQVVDKLPANPDSNTLYVVREVTK